MGAKTSLYVCLALLSQMRVAALSSSYPGDDPILCLLAVSSLAQQSFIPQIYSCMLLCYHEVPPIAFSEKPSMRAVTVSVVSNQFHWSWKYLLPDFTS